MKERLNWEHSVEIEEVVNYDAVMRTTRVKEEDEEFEETIYIIIIIW